MAFIKNLKDRHFEYWKWVKFNIEYLSKVERDQRHKKKPEPFRYFEVMFDGYTVINLIYTVLTAWSFISYVSIVLDSFNMHEMYPIWPDLTSDDMGLAERDREEHI